jgi:hypothetical protein
MKRVAAIFAQKILEKMVLFILNGEGSTLCILNITYQTSFTFCVVEISDKILESTSSNDENLKNNLF